MTKLSDEELKALRTAGPEVVGAGWAPAVMARVLDSHASLEAEVLRLRASHARLMDATSRCDSVRCQEANDADDVPAAPTPAPPPSKSVQRRLAAQGAPTSAPRCICPPGWVAEQGGHGNLCPARFYPTAAETDAAVASIVSKASAPTSGQGAAATWGCSACHDTKVILVYGNEEPCVCAPAPAAQPRPVPRTPEGALRNVMEGRLPWDPGEAGEAQPTTETCATCRGKGELLHLRPRPGSAPGNQLATCYDCGGTGTTPRKEGP